MDDFARNGVVVNRVVKFSGDPLNGGGLMTGAEVAVSLQPPHSWIVRRSAQGNRSGLFIGNLRVRRTCINTKVCIVINSKLLIDESK